MESPPSNLEVLAHETLERAEALLFANPMRTIRVSVDHVVDLPSGYQVVASHSHTKPSQTKRFDGSLWLYSPEPADQPHVCAPPVMYAKVGDVLAGKPIPSRRNPLIYQEVLEGTPVRSALGQLLLACMNATDSADLSDHPPIDLQAANDAFTDLIANGNMTIDSWHYWKLGDQHGVRVGTRRLIDNNAGHPLNYHLHNPKIGVMRRLGDICRQLEILDSNMESFDRPVRELDYLAQYADEVTRDDEGIVESLSGSSTSHEALLNAERTLGYRKLSASKIDWILEGIVMAEALD